MNVLSTILSGGITELAKGVADIVDRFVQTSDEKARLQVEIMRLAYEQQAKMVASADAYEGELTARLVADAASDSWLAKNIRPLALIYLLGAFTLLAFNDGNLHFGEWHFEVAEIYIKSLTSFLEFGLMFYFGGRSLEKIATSIADARKA